MSLRDIFKSREFRIFLFFFIVFVLFSHWTGWNGSSRLALTKSIYENEKLNIDEFANSTGDRSVYKGQYYSDKAPGTSLLNLAPYSLHKKLDDSLVTENTDSKSYIEHHRLNLTLRVPFKPSKENIGSKFVSIVFSSAFMGSLLILLIYRSSKFFTSEKYSLLVTMIFGLGTTIFIYSTVFMGAITATFLSFLSFYILLYLREKESVNNNLYYLIGVLSGFSVVMEYYTGVIGLFLLFYIYKTEGFQNTKKFLSGFSFGFVPLLVYNLVIFNNPLHLTFFNIDGSGFYNFMRAYYSNHSAGAFPSNFIFIINSLLFNIPRILFYPFRGLFFYTPAVLISLPGFYFLYKEDRKLSIGLIAIFSVLIIYFAQYSHWWGGSSFGMRYITFLIPFLSIPFVFVLNHLKRIQLGLKKPIYIIIAILVSISIFCSFMSFNEWTDLNQKPEDYFDTLFSFRTFGNPLYVHYLPEFIDHGPRSQILAGLLTGDLDLRYMHPYPKQVFVGLLPSLGFLMLQIPFLSLYIVFILFLVIWWKELKGLMIKRLPEGLNNGKIVVATLAFASILLFLPFLNTTDIHYANNWYAQRSNRTGRWMSQNGTITFTSRENEVKNLNLTIGTHYKPRDLHLYLDEDLIDVVRINSANQTVIVPNVTIEKGVNSLRLYSKQGCSRPSKDLKNSTDFRCLSFKVKNVSYALDRELGVFKEPIYYKNWYKAERNNESGKKYRWASQSPGLLFRDTRDHQALLNLTIKSFYESRNVSLFINDEFLEEYTLDNSSLRILTPLFSLRRGNNIIEMRTDECFNASRVEDNESRCLSLQLQDFEILSYSYLMGENKTMFYRKGFYSREKSDEGVYFRWMKEKGRLYFLSDSRLTRLNLRGWPYRTSKEIGLYSNGGKIDNFSFNRSKSSAKTPLIISSKEFPLEIVSRQGCQVPAEVESSNDTRCVSIALSEIERKESENLLEAIDSGFDRNWHPLERLDEEKFRWMSQNTTLSLFNTRDENLTLEGELISYLKNRTLKVFRNGGLLGEMKVERDKKRKLDLVLIPGSNDLKFVSEKGCDKPLEIEKNSSDDRCLSFGFKKLKVEEDCGE